MKKVFWGLMYFLAFLLAAFTIHLYVLPERELLIAAEGNTELEQWKDMPIIRLNDTEIRVGETKVRTFVEGGFQFRFSSGGELFVLNLSEAKAEPKMQYEMHLFFQDTEIGTLKYTNLQETKIPVLDCIVDVLDCKLSEEAVKNVQFRMEEVFMNSLTIHDAPKKFPDFTKAGGKDVSYRKSVISAVQSSVAYIKGEDKERGYIRSFGVRNYIPKEFGKKNGNH